MELLTETLAPSSRRRLVESPAALNDFRSVFPFLLLLLAASGCAALIYEIVWLQLLQLVIGSSAISLGLLLAAYMGGLCLGSALFPRAVSPARNPLRVYAAIELGIAAFGLLVLWGTPVVSRMYVFGASGGRAGLILRGLIACICLLPPTVLMGASLPAIARWLETTPKGMSSLGFLYSSNIAGAVFGALLAGFYLLRVFDLAITTYVAVALNAIVAGAAWLLSARSRQRPAFGFATIRGAVEEPGAYFVYSAIALSGLSALGAQVVWTRLLSLLLGATVYTFSIILAVFLFGLWAGSSAGSLLARNIKSPRQLLAGCQLLLALSIGWTAHTMAYSLPYWPVDPWLSLNPWFNFELDLVRCVWAIFPATVLWGACFPLALASVAANGQDPGRITGRVYAANTAGSIVGALAFSLWIIPVLGTRVAEQMLIGLSIVTAVIAAVPWPNRKVSVGGSMAAIVLGGALIATVADVPWEVVAYGRRMAPTVRAFDLYPQQPAAVLYRGEGISSSVVIVERAGERTFYVSGKVEASTASLDMRLERMMGHIPALLHPNPRSVLTVGFGAGITAGSFVPYPEVNKLVICELEPFIPPASTAFFGAQNNRVFKDPRTRVVYDDARHYIFTANDKFDVITTDPIHPWVKGMSTLYSREYYELVKSHLNPGGVVAQWLPIYDSDLDTVKSELATFFSVFPGGTVWSNFLNKDGYDLVLIGQPNGESIDVDSLQQRLDRPAYSGVMASIGEVGFHSAVEVLATYAGRASDLQHWLAAAQVNDDLNMRLQYLAGLGLNSMGFPKIYNELLTYRRFPEGLIAGSPGGRMDALKVLLRPRTVRPSQKEIR
jgi:spermidine synthase